VQRVESGNLLKSPVELPQLITPRTFLNALRQQSARAAKIPIDTMMLTCSWDPSILPKSAVVKVAVQGLLIQESTFKGNRLEPLAPDSPTVSVLPSVTFAYIAKTVWNLLHLFVSFL